MNNARMMTRSLLIAATVTTVFLLAGCAGTSAPVATGPQTVSMDNLQFVPKELTVAKGTTITWSNDDDFAHDVTGKGKAWQSEGGDGGMAIGEKWSKTFDTAGTYEYYCSIHSTGPGNGQWGTIVVK